MNKVYQGDWVDLARRLDDESIDLIMTSPPYWGLRDYGVSGQLGLESHPKQFIANLIKGFNVLKQKLKKSGSLYLNLGDTYFGSPTGSLKGLESSGYDRPSRRASFEAGKSLRSGKPDPKLPERLRAREQFKGEKSNWLQPKQKMLMPHRVAIALQEDGWILRNDIVWHKPNPMPSSVKDRLNTCFEFVFHFVRSKKYFYDLDAIREEHNTDYKSFNRRVRDVKARRIASHQYKDSEQELKSKDKLGNYKADGLNLDNRGIIEKRKLGISDSEIVNPLGKNPGDVFLFDDNYWRNFLLGDSHSNRFHKEAFELMRKWMIKNDCYDYSKFYEWYKQQKKGDWDSGNLEKGQMNKLNKCLPFPKPENRLLGKNPGDFWSITTQPFPEAHFAVFPEELCRKPILSSCPKGGVVLDPFCGSGTALLVAQKLKRRFLGFELNKDYVKMAEKRLGLNHKLLREFA